MADAEHSLFSASKAVMWMACPGSLVLGKDAPRKASRYAAEGTAAHQLASWCLEEGKDAVAYLDRVIAADGFEFEVDADMARDVQVYVDQVREYATSCAEGLMIIVDLKFGRGEEVEAQGNPQMQCYALGGLAMVDMVGSGSTPTMLIEQRVCYAQDVGADPAQAFGTSDAIIYHGDKIERVLMVIIQPRISHAPKEWEIDVAQLREFAGNAAEAVGRCFDARQEYPAPDWHEKYTKATEKGCRWCPAKAGCPTLRQAVTETVYETAPASPEDFAASVYDNGHIKSTDKFEGHDGPAWLAACLTRVDMIEEWCKAIRAEAESIMLTGGTVAGFKLVQGKRGNRQWADVKAAEEAMKAMRLKVEEMYDLKVISPTSAEKLAKSKVIGPRQWPKLQELITQGEGKLHVAPNTDPREAIIVTPVDNEFEAVAPQGESVDDLA